MSRGFDSMREHTALALVDYWIPSPQRLEEIRRPIGTSAPPLGGAALKIAHHWEKPAKG